MLAIIDYGVGNLFSLNASLNFLGAPVTVTGDPDEIRRADRLILPGVGAFGDAMDKLRATGLDRVLREEADRGKPLLGICLGMQMLFERSDEYGLHEGLGLVPGRVTALAPLIPAEFKIPHMGWNQLDVRGADPLFAGMAPGSYVYYVHSYFATDCDAHTTATSWYGIPVTGAVRKGNVAGTQFHPEKSGPAGLSILKAFLD